jgi:hypothetical protein
MKTTYIPTVLASVLLASCGGSSSDSGNSTSAVEAPDLTAGGANSQLQCTGSNTFEPTGGRTDEVCDLAKILYLDIDQYINPQVLIYSDFKDTGADYIGTDDVHTGIDMQGGGNLKRSRIGSLSNGIVEFIQRGEYTSDKDTGFGYVVIRSFIPGVGHRAFGYMHMTGIPEDLKVGDIVKRKDFLGYEGNMGLNADPDKRIHLHLEALNNQYASKVPSINPEDAHTWGDEVSRGVVIDILDLAPNLINDETQVPDPLIAAYVPPKWESNKANDLYGLVEVRDGFKFEFINSFSNVAYTSETFNPTPDEKGYVNLSSEDYRFSTVPEVNNLPTGKYSLRISVFDGSNDTYEDYPFYFTQNNPDIGPAPAPEQETILDVKLDRDTYIYFGEEIDLGGCVTSTTPIIGMEIELDTPRGDYQQTYIAGSNETDVMEATDNCNGYAGYDIDLEIDPYTDGFNSATEALGDYELTVKILFEDDTSTTLDVMTVEVISQVDRLDLGRTNPPGTIDVTGYYKSPRSDGYKITRLSGIKVRIDGYDDTNPNGTIISERQFTNDNGYSGFNYTTVFNESSASIGTVSPLVSGETYDYQIISKIRSVEVVLAEGQVTLY